MSRMGELVKSQRLKYRMTPKQLAKKCGVSEAFVLEVESGKRIPNDVIATRMLKAMGTVDEVMNDLNVETDSRPEENVQVRQIVRPQPKPAPAAAGEISDTWKDALSGVLKRVPVLDASGKTVAYRMLAADDGKIEGAKAESVFYLTVPDSSMRAYRIARGDLALCVPAKAPGQSSIMAFTLHGEFMIRRVRKIDGNRAELTWFDAAQETLMCDITDLGSLSSVVRVEFVPR